MRNPIPGGRTPEYQIWKGMLRRCQNPAHPKWLSYGGRGIQVCERWQSYELFLQDVGPRPSSKYWIERINNNGNYEPGNVRWALPVEQMNNKRSNVFITYQGRTQTIAEWGRELGHHRRTIWARFKKGWPVTKILAPSLFPRGGPKST